MTANVPDYNDDLIGPIHLSQHFEQVFNRFFESLCLFATGFLEDQELAKDIVSDVFLKILKKKESLSFESINQVKSFLFRSTGNAAIDHYRKNKRTVKNLNDYGQHHLRLQSESGWETIEKKAAIRAMAVEKVFEIILELSEEQRQVVQLSMKGLSTVEIAEELQKHEGTIRKYRISAIHAIRKHLGNEFEEIPALLLICYLWSEFALEFIIK